MEQTPFDDKVDSPQPTSERKWPPNFYGKDVFFALLAWFTFALDYGTDLRLMIQYQLDGEMVLFWLTFGFIAAPSFITGIISTVWYNQTYKQDEQLYVAKKEDNPAKSEYKRKQRKSSRTMFALRVVLSFLQLGRIFRQIEYIYCILHSFRLQRCIRNTEDEDQRKNLRIKEENLRHRAVNEKRDAAMLGLIDGFLESALQLLLQLYLTIYLSLPLTFARVSSLCASLVSTSLIHTSYYRANRKANKNKYTVTYLSSAFYFLWRFFELAPRYLLLSLTCALFTPWCFIALPVHIVFVYILYKSQNPELLGVCPEYKNYTCISSILKQLFIFLISYLGLLSFVNLKEGDTKRITAIFYIVFYTENVIMALLVLWYSISRDEVTGWTYSLCIMPIGLVCHMIFAAIFYKCFHPKLRKSRYLMRYNYLTSNISFKYFQV
ncbi:hypothetical protein FSP39_025121 [Pinctada imbricata]|uniref:XK-related protein n=1 Tax=Pinctada imbricata TaxID=66713 RepID=A0AA89BV57_PINIB|nr:hypothetical protein FSP39_025121 [Pinctada imbricata]